MSLPNVEEVRKRVESIPRKEVRMCLMTAYLFAGRISEVVGHASPKDNTTARGPSGKDAKLDSYRDKEPCVVFSVKTAKRQGLERKVALPLEYESWAEKVYDYFREFGDDAVFPFTRQKVGMYVDDNEVFSGLTYPIEKYKICVHQQGVKLEKVVDRHMRPYTLHALRHSRASELVDFYGFDGFNLASYGGWTFRTLARTTVTMDRYLSFSWQSYFEKLLKKRK